VLPEAPSIFRGGLTQGAIMNQDYSFNSAANPAPAGSVIQIFATGLGETNPPLPAGEAASTQPPYNVTVNPVAVWIGGQRADVQFSGVAPGFAGLFQINAIVPRSSPARQLRPPADPGQREAEQHRDAGHQALAHESHEWRSFLDGVKPVSLITSQHRATVATWLHFCYAGPK
jgi:hypothetical protein